MRHAVIVAAAAVVLAGCASHKPTSGPVDTAFLDGATAQCIEALDQVSPNPFPYPSFDPLNPLVTQLPAAGAYYDKEDFNHKELQFVKGFGTPKRGQRTWNVFVNLVSNQQAEVGVQIVAAKASNKPAFVASVQRIQALAKQLDAAAAAVGFPANSACIQLFG